MWAVLWLGLFACAPHEGGIKALPHRELRTDEERLVVSVAALARDFPSFHPVVERAGIQHGDGEDGSHTLIYEYNYGSGSTNSVRTSTTLYAMDSEGQAHRTFAALTPHSLDQLKENFPTATRGPGWVAWGDESVCGPILESGEIIGNLCSFRRGTKMLFFSLTGVAYTRPEDLDALLKPRLSALESWRP